MRSLALCGLVACVSETPKLPDVAPESTSNEVMADGPDILLVVLDTLRSDALQLYGPNGVTTPHLEAHIA